MKDDKPKFRVERDGSLTAVNIPAINESLRKDEFGMYVHASNWQLMRTMIFQKKFSHG